MRKKLIRIIVIILGIMMFLTSSHQVTAEPVIPDETAEYLHRILPWIVPDGTPEEKVPVICAVYESRILEYDFDLQERILEKDRNACEEGWEYYEHPEKSLETSKGLCSSYSGLYTAMVGMVPINPETKRVDYLYKKPVYLKSSMIRNPYHVFSAVRLDGKWHMYDTCWYDTSGGEDCYLDITDKEIMEDESHKDWYFVN